MRVYKHGYNRFEHGETSGISQCRKSGRVRKIVEASETGGDLEHDTIPLRKCYVSIVNFEAVLANKNDANEVRIIKDDEQCKLCGEWFEEKIDVILHLAKKHLQPGLVHQLHRTGWKNGEDICPVCKEVPGVEMLVHWAKDHGKAEEMLEKLGGGEIRLAEDRNCVNNYLVDHTPLKVNITSHRKLTVDAEIILNNSGKRVDKLDHISDNLDNDTTTVSNSPNIDVASDDESMSIGSHKFLERGKMKVEVKEHATKSDIDAPGEKETLHGGVIKSIEETSSLADEVRAPLEPMVGCVPDAVEALVEPVEKLNSNESTNEEQESKYDSELLFDSKEDTKRMILNITKNSDEDGQKVIMQDLSEEDKEKLHKTENLTFVSESESGGWDGGGSLSKPRPADIDSSSPSLLEVEKSTPKMQMHSVEMTQNSFSQFVEIVKGQSTNTSVNTKEEFKHDTVSPCSKALQISKSMIEETKIDTTSARLETVKTAGSIKHTTEVQDTPGISLEMAKTTDSIQHTLEESKKIIEELKTRDSVQCATGVSNVKLGVTHAKPQASRDHITKMLDKGNDIVCKICSTSFPARRDFTDHLAAKHFHTELYQQIVSASTSLSSCPSCSVFKTKNVDLLIVHYGARCKPFPVNKLYSDWVDEEISESHCIFCGDRAFDISQLYVHLADKHVDEILEKMGFMFLFKQEQVKSEMGIYTQHYCPLCDRTDSDRNLCIHLIRNHSQQFTATYQEYTESLFSTAGVICQLCQTWHGTARQCLEHLALMHFPQDLISECGFSPDLMLACNSCNYISRTEKDMILHYGINHQRVDFFYTQEIVQLQKAGKVTVSGSDMKIEMMDSQDFSKLASLMGTFGTRDELSVRSVILNSTSSVYKSLLQYINKDIVTGCYNCNICDLKLKSEDLMVAHVGLRPHFKADIQLRVEAAHQARNLTCKLCDEVMMSYQEFWDHQARDHFYDDLVAALGEKDQVSREYNCPDTQCSFSNTNVELVIQHLVRSHQKVQEIYKKIKVTKQLLTCKICDKDHRNVHDLKIHLATEHFKAELVWENVIQLPNGSLLCRLCKNVEPSTNMDIIETHIATIHNTVDNLYTRKSKGESIGKSYICELCGWFTSRKEQFLNHITIQHCMQLFTQLIKRSIVRHDISGRELYMCPNCRSMFNTIRDYRNHIVKDINCNQSLGFYYWLVDTQKYALPNPQLLSAAHAWERLYHANLPRGRHLTSEILKLGRIETEDPCSSDIEMVYNPYSCNVEVFFKENLSPNSFRPLQILNGEIFQCYFCDLSEVDCPFTETNKSVFLIHLAETHFKDQLVKMFTVIRDGLEFLECNVCSTAVLFENFQDLFEHCASNHDVIEGIYEATKPKKPPNITESIPDFLAKDQLMLSCLYSWFPVPTPKVTLLHQNRTIEENLEVCTGQVENLHRKRKFFMEDLERKRRKSGC